MTTTREKFKTKILRRTQNDIDTEQFYKWFLKKYSRPPTLFDVMKRFGLKSVSAAWERLERIKNQHKKCILCGK
jgi:hypothetical protein